MFYTLFTHGIVNDIIMPMDKDQWKKVETIIDQVLSVSGKEERTKLINKCCGDNDKLRKEVETFLDSIDASGNIWDELLISNRVLMDEMTQNENLSSIIHSEGEQPARIGFYEIKRKIGRGGMGDVYLAERSEGGFHQKVALKLIRREMASEIQTKRFLQERTLLSKLNHPNIAGLLDGGVSDDGRPFFVMEYVDGMPVTEYCKTNECTLEERLSIFEQICEAVQYAHTNLIVHRDLKPDNLMVTAGGMVKVLDFGIAKLLDQELSENSLVQTGESHRMLSLNYAAPEQITMGTVTTSTDVYTLGLLLYELLSDRKPFDLKKKKLQGAEQIIRYREPAKPSEVTKKRKKELLGDLDAIIMKALRKEPEKRYETASSILEDIRRYRLNKPVLARKGTFRYRYGKFLKRNRLIFTSTSLILVILTGFSILYAVRINQEKSLAELEAEKARLVTDYLKSIFEFSDPNQSSGETISAKDLLKAGSEQVDNLNEQPEVKAEILATFGGINYSLGDYVKADSLFQESLSIRRKLEDDADEEIASILYQMALNKENMGQYDIAESLFTESLEMQKQLYDENDINIIKNLNSLAYLYQLKGELGKATDYIDRGLTALQSMSVPDSVELAEAHHLRASIFTAQGYYNRAISSLQEALQLCYSLYSLPHPKINKSLANLARNYQKLGDYNTADSFYFESLQMSKALYDGDHLSTAITMNNMAGLYKLQENYIKADSMYAESLTMLEKVLGEKHPYVASNLFNLANLKREMGKYSEAEELYRQTITLDTLLLGADHPNVATDYNGLGLVLADKGEYESALEYFIMALDIQEKRYENPNHLHLLDTKSSLALIYEKMDEFVKAELFLKEVYHGREKVLGSDHANTKSVKQRLVRLLEKRGKFSEADLLKSSE